MAQISSWVLDTNVVVSGLLFATGVPGRLIDMILVRKLRLTFDDRIEAEYREVLTRPKFNIPTVRLEAFLTVLQFQDAVIALPWLHTHPPDPNDTMFLEVGMHATDRIFVTGNLRHFPANCRGPVQVLTPRKAWLKFVWKSFP